MTILLFMLSIPPTWFNIVLLLRLTILQYQDFEAYFKGHNICMAFKIVWYEPYKNLQFLSITTYSWKDLSMNFVTELPVSANWKSESYDSTFIIVD